MLHVRDSAAARRLQLLTCKYGSLPTYQAVNPDTRTGGQPSSSVIDTNPNGLFGHLARRADMPVKVAS